MLRFMPVANVLGALLMVFALTYLLPIATALVYDDGTVLDFLFAMVLNFALGFVLWAATRRQGHELRSRDG